ncbi:hypothetical protein GCM10020255_064010 [Rhodococcus baikonurensis]
MSTPLPSYTSGVWDGPMLGDTIGDNLDRTVAAHGDRDALIDHASGRRWTYREFAEQVNGLAAGLLSRGVGKGDRVGIWAPNCPEWTFTQYATAKIGAILVNINPAYRSHELQYVLEQAGISTLVSAASFKTSDYASMIETVRPQCPDLTSVLLLGSPEWDAVLADGLAAQASDPAPLAAAQAALSADDAINIQYTSGTTGFPKVRRSATTTFSTTASSSASCATTAKSIGCASRCRSTCFGMVMGNLACTSHGAAMVIPGPAFDPRASLEAVQAEKCTSLYGVPTMFIAELALPDFESFDLSSLRTGIMAGSPCPVEVMKQVIDRMGMAEVSICYGMTETSPVSLQTRSDDSIAQRTETVGRVGPTSRSRSSIRQQD